jgi:hypothetical protein
MRGLGGLYQRGEVWRVTYHHGARKYRESSRFADRNDATRLVRHRLAALNTGKPGGSEEEDLTFEDLAADYIQEREVRGNHGTLPPAVQEPRSEPQGFLRGLRAAEITTHPMREHARTAAGEPQSSLSGAT